MKNKKLKRKIAMIFHNLMMFALTAGFLIFFALSLYCFYVYGDIGWDQFIEYIKTDGFFRI